MSQVVLPPMGSGAKIIVISKRSYRKQVSQIALSTIDKTTKDITANVRLFNMLVL